MTERAFSTIFGPALWVHVERIVSRIPRHLDVGACRTGMELIDTLGNAGAFDALRAYSAALEEYQADALFQALRAAIHESLFAPDRQGYGKEPFDDARWAQMFDMTWQRAAPRSRRRLRGRWKHAPRST